MVTRMALRKHKQTRTQQVTGLAVDYLKLKAAGKAVKGAGKAAKGTAKTASKAPVVKRIPVLIGAGVAAVVATKVVKGRRSEPAPA